jgi:hypothetical protein
MPLMPGGSQSRASPAVAVTSSQRRNARHVPGWRRSSRRSHAGDRRRRNAWSAPRRRSREAHIASIGDVSVTDSIEQRTEGWPHLHIISVARCWQMPSAVSRQGKTGRPEVMTSVIRQPADGGRTSHRRAVRPVRACLAPRTGEWLREQSSAPPAPTASVLSLAR